MLYSRECNSSKRMKFKASSSLGIRKTLFVVWSKEPSKKTLRFATSLKMIRHMLSCIPHISFIHVVWENNKMVDSQANLALSLSKGTIQVNERISYHPILQLMNVPPNTLHDQRESHPHKNSNVNSAREPQTSDSTQV
jgi:hypothetical protein